MGTRSTIAILKKDGSVESIFCHWDGYPSHNGAILYEHFKSPAKVQKLINLGSLSSIGKELDFPEGQIYDANKRTSGICVAHFRDFPRDSESKIEIDKFTSFDDYNKSNDGQEYDYLFDVQKKQWFLHDFNNEKLFSLKAALLQDEEVDLSFKEKILKKDADKLEKKLAVKDNDNIKRPKI